MNQSASNPVSAPATSAAAGKYSVIAELGRGGMATVFLAVAQGPGGFNKLQVVKRLRPALAVDPEFLQMFLEEARLSARINHPHVVQTNEVGFDGVYHYIAMEYLDGQALETILRRTNEKKQPLPLTMHLRVIADCLAGLHAAHELTDFEGNPLNVVHRDVSPHNVMVTYDGQVKVLDFGIAKAADSSGDTRTGIMKGKCAYMAAEQFGGTKVDRRADVFAVGVMLWQALTGARMWKGLSDADIFQRLATGDIRKPTTVKPDIHPELEAIVMRALALKPEDRYPTAADFQSDIEKHLRSLGDHGTARDIGKFVSALFADSRAALKTAIEQQMKANATASELAKKHTAEVPLLWQLVPGATGEISAAAGSTPSMTPVSGHNSGEFDAQRSGSAPISMRSSALPARRNDRLAIFAGIGVIALGVLVVAAAGAYRKHGVEPVVSGPAPTAVIVTVPPQVVVSVKATPSQAHIFVDDVPLPTNPATSTFVKDGTSHRLRVEAPGYQKKFEFITYDSNTVSVDIALEPEVAARTPIATSGLPSKRGSGGGAAARVAEAPAVVAAPPVATPNDPTPKQPVVAPPVAPVAAPPPPPVAAAALAPGTVDSRGVRSTVHAHGSEVQACYDRAHMEKPDLHGRVVVGAAIGLSGEVLSASVTSTTANSSRLETCLLGAFNRWVFPVPAGGVNGNVSYTFVFD